MWVMRMSPRGQQGGAGVVYVECNFFSLRGVNPYGQPAVGLNMVGILLICIWKYLVLCPL